MRIVLVKNQDLLKSKKLIEIKTSFEVIPILGNIISILGNIIQRYKMSKLVNRFLLAEDLYQKSISLKTMKYEQIKMLVIQDILIETN